ncbi:MAG: hypothetical protein OSJ45_06800 [Lachnospiraceae bacterium]|nr:hypothetical protein [Lachnospiraceae bacterium]
MSVSSISGTTPAYETTTTTAAAAAKEAAQQKDTTAAEKNTSSEVVYEKSNTTKKDSANQIYNRDSVISKLKADQKSRADSMRGLVEKLLSKQTNKYNLANTNLSTLFGAAAKNADPATIKKAQEDISEDGYWGVNKTSDRLVSMAIALAGGDTGKADEMMAAIQKGYDKATAAWGKELPDISKRTLEATKQKMEDWKNGKTTAQDYADYLS